MRFLKRLRIKYHQACIDKFKDRGDCAVCKAAILYHIRKINYLQG